MRKGTPRCQTHLKNPRLRNPHHLPVALALLRTLKLPKTPKLCTLPKPSSQVISRISQIFCSFLILLPIALFFSYYPILHLGDNATMNFELSIPLLWLVAFDLFGLFVIVRKHLVRESLSWTINHWYWLLFPAFLTFTLAWSLNPLRGFLTAGILWLIYLAIFLFFVLKKVLNFPPNFAHQFWRTFFGTSLVICAWCWIQCLMDLSGEPQSRTLLCDGCTATIFGFPRADGFAIEPQCMGNLLLAPALFAAWFALDPRRRQCRYLTLLFAFTATLFLTLSRGAIYAFLVLLIFLTIIQIIRTKKFTIIKSWLITILAFFVTLGAQGIMATIGPTSDTFSTAVTKTIHQLSLGLIDLRNAAPEGTSTSAEPAELTPTDPAPEPEQPAEDTPTTPVFDGYIAGSTDARLRLTDSALQIWRASPTTTLLGVGLGGAGQALYDHNLSPAPKEIVQNEYFSLLLETGLVGVFLAAITILAALRLILKNPLSTPIFALVIAYAVTLCFFSGFANALQIYLLPPIFALVATIPSSHIANLPPHKHHLRPPHLIRK